MNSYALTIFLRQSLNSKLNVMKNWTGNAEQFVNKE